MKKLIFFALCLFSTFAIAQKADIIKFRGKVTPAVRNGLDVPSGETWLIQLSTTGELQVAESDDVWKKVITSGNNQVTEDDGIALQHSIVNFIEVANNHPTLDDPFVRIVGGAQPNEVYLFITSDMASLSNLSIADIDAVGNSSMVTREWVVNYVLNNSGGSSTDDQTASEVPFTPNANISSTNVQNAIVETYNAATATTGDFINKTSTNQFVDIGTNTGSFWDLLFINNTVTTPIVSRIRSFASTISLRTFESSNEFSVFSNLGLNAGFATITANDGTGSKSFRFDNNYGDNNSDVATRDDVDGAISAIPDKSAAQIPTNTSTFNNNLSSSDSDVQSALNTLDDLVALGSPLSTSNQTISPGGTTRRINLAPDGGSPGGLRIYANPSSTGSIVQYSPNQIMYTQPVVLNYSISNDLHAVNKLYVDNAVSGSSGNVTGPNSSTDNQIAVFDGATGQLLKTGTASINPSGSLFGVTSVSTSGNNAFFGLQPTDNEPASLEGNIYSDDSENRIKVHDGSSFRALAFQDELGGGSLTPQVFQDQIYETQLPNGVYTKFVKPVTQTEYNNLSNDDVYGLNGVEYYIVPSAPSGYGISNFDLSTITAPTFDYASAEIDAGLDWSVTDGTATVSGFFRPIVNASGTITMTDLSSLADGTLTLTVSLINGGGRGSDVTETATKGSGGGGGTQFYVDRAGAASPDSATSVGGWVAGNGISSSSTAQARTGTTSLLIQSNTDGTEQFRYFDFSSGSSGQTDFSGGETVTVTGWVYSPANGNPDINLTGSSLGKTAITFTTNTWTQFTFTGVSVSSSGNLYFYVDSASGVYFDDIQIFEE